MTDRLIAADWVNSIAAKRQKPSRNNYAVRNGNRTGHFRREAVIVHGDQEFIVSADSEFCVYGSMGGSGVAATIFDQVNGDITIRKNGKIVRNKPLSGSSGAPRHMRTNVPLGIG